MLTRLETVTVREGVSMVEPTLRSCERGRVGARGVKMFHEILGRGSKTPPAPPVGWKKSSDPITVAPVLSRLEPGDLV